MEEGGEIMRTSEGIRERKGGSSRVGREGGGEEGMGEGEGRRGREDTYLTSKRNMLESS